MLLSCVCIAVQFQLGDQTYSNDSEVLLTDIGEGDNALLCLTDNTQCCRGGDNPNGGGLGEWYFPDGTLVPTGNNTNIYRNRDLSAVRLNRKNNAQSPIGVYRCEVPDASGTSQSIYIHLTTGKYALLHITLHYCCNSINYPSYISHPRYELLNLL